MPRLKSEIEVSLILREANQKQEARAILGAPPYPKRLSLVTTLAASSLSALGTSFATMFEISQHILFGLLLGTMVACVGLSFEVMFIRRRLEAAIQLINLDGSSSDNSFRMEVKEASSEQLL
jgi:hypothetical protein